MMLAKRLCFESNLKRSISSPLFLLQQLTRYMLNHMVLPHAIIPGQTITFSQEKKSTIQCEVQLVPRLQTSTGLCQQHGALWACCPAHGCTASPALRSHARSMCSSNKTRLMCDLTLHLVKKFQAKGQGSLFHMR